MSYAGKTLASACLAAALLAGCSQPTRTPPPQTPAASEKPSPTVSGRPSPTPSQTTAVSGRGGSADFPRPDYRALLFGRLDCFDAPEAKRRADVYAVKRADLTGDGRKEAVVTGGCFHLTGPDAPRVFVFDGTDLGGKPLVVIGDQHALTSAEVRLSGGRVTVKSRALSERAGTCCSDQLITQTYRWDGSGFKRVSLVVKAG